MNQTMTAEEYQAHLKRKKKGPARVRWPALPVVARPTLPDGETLPVFRLVLPFATPSLNDTKGEHWRDKTDRRTRYEQYIRLAKPPRYPGAVRVSIYRHSSGTLDTDNFFGGAKELCDALVNCSVMLDDTDIVIPERHYEQVKILRSAKPMTVVEVHPLSPTDPI